MIFEPVGLGMDRNLFSKEEKIALNKQFSALMRDVRAEIKEDTCLCCGRKVSSFCSSHMVPRFCLENIGIDGKVTGYNAIMNLPSMGISQGKETPGIGEAGIFWRM